VKSVIHVQCDARPTVTFPGTLRHCPLTGTVMFLGLNRPCVDISASGRHIWTSEKMLEFSSVVLQACVTCIMCLHDVQDIRRAWNWRRKWFRSSRAMRGSAWSASRASSAWTHTTRYVSTAFHQKLEALHTSTKARLASVVIRIRDPDLW